MKHPCALRCPRGAHAKRGAGMERESEMSKRETQGREASTGAEHTLRVERAVSGRARKRGAADRKRARRAGSGRVGARGGASMGGVRGRLQSERGYGKGSPNKLPAEKCDLGKRPDPWAPSGIAARFRARNLLESVPYPRSDCNRGCGSRAPKRPAPLRRPHRRARRQERGLRTASHRGVNTGRPRDRRAVSTRGAGPSLRARRLAGGVAARRPSGSARRARSGGRASGR